MDLRESAGGVAGRAGRAALGAVLAGLLLCMAPVRPSAGEAQSGPGPGPVPAPYTGLDLVTGNDYAPYTGEDLPGGGLVTELVRQSFAVGGRRFDVRFLPWKRGYDGVVLGRFLATFPYVRTPEREREVLFSDPVVEVRQYVYLSKRSAMEFHGGGIGGNSGGGADFRGRTVCQPAGYALPAELEEMVQLGRLTRHTPSDLGACVRMVAAGRADALVIDEYSGAASIARAGLAEEIRVSEQPFAVVTLHLVVGRATPGADAMVAAFNDGLKMLKQQGIYDRLLAAHTVQPAP